jgi:hypothetical protein
MADFSMPSSGVFFNVAANINCHYRHQVTKSELMHNPVFIIKKWGLGVQKWAA